MPVSRGYGGFQPSYSSYYTPSYYSPGTYSSYRSTSYAPSSSRASTPSRSMISLVPDDRKRDFRNYGLSPMAAPAAYKYFSRSDFYNTTAVYNRSMTSSNYNAQSASRKELKTVKTDELDVEREAVGTKREHAIPGEIKRDTAANIAGGKQVIRLVTTNRKTNPYNIVGQSSTSTPATEKPTEELSMGQRLALKHLLVDPKEKERQEAARVKAEAAAAKAAEEAESSEAESEWTWETCSESEAEDLEPDKPSAQAKTVPASTTRSAIDKINAPTPTPYSAPNYSSSTYSPDLKKSTSSTATTTSGSSYYVSTTTTSANTEKKSIPTYPTWMRTTGVSYVTPTTSPAVTSSASIEGSTYKRSSWLEPSTTTTTTTTSSTTNQRKIEEETSNSSSSNSVGSPKFLRRYGGAGSKTLLELNDNDNNNNEAKSSDGSSEDGLSHVLNIGWRRGQPPRSDVVVKLTHSNDANNAARVTNKILVQDTKAAMTRQISNTEKRVSFSSPSNILVENSSSFKPSIVSRFDDNKNAALKTSNHLVDDAKTLPSSHKDETALSTKITSNHSEVDNSKQSWMSTTSNVSTKSTSIHIDEVKKPVVREIKVPQLKFATEGRTQALLMMETGTLRSNSSTGVDEKGKRSIVVDEKCLATISIQVTNEDSSPLQSSNVENSFMSKGIVHVDNLVYATRRDMVDTSTCAEVVQGFEEEEMFDIPSDFVDILPVKEFVDVVLQPARPVEILSMVRQPIVKLHEEKVISKGEKLKTDPQLATPSIEIRQPVSEPQQPQPKCNQVSHEDQPKQQPQLLQNPAPIQKQQQQPPPEEAAVRAKKKKPEPETSTTVATKDGKPKKKKEKAKAKKNENDKSTPVGIENRLLVPPAPIGLSTSLPSSAAAPQIIPDLPEARKAGSASRDNIRELEEAIIATQLDRVPSIFRKVFEAKAAGENYHPEKPKEIPKYWNNEPKSVDPSGFREMAQMKQEVKKHKEKIKQEQEALIKTSEVESDEVWYKDETKDFQEQLKLYEHQASDHHKGGDQRKTPAENAALIRIYGGIQFPGTPIEVTPQYMLRPVPGAGGASGGSGDGMRCHSESEEDDAAAFSDTAVTAQMSVTGGAGGGTGGCVSRQRRRSVPPSTTGLYVNEPPVKTRPPFRKYGIEDFRFHRVLGKGSFGKVILAELRNGSQSIYAVKCLKKDLVLEDDDIECTLIERKVLALGCKHPFICHLFCTFQTDSHLFFAMEYLNGGDLMFHIQQSSRFDFERARFYASEVLLALKFLHKKGIVYRDLKLDNVLLDHEGHIRLADFGMCKLQIYLDRMTDTFCGTPDYMAPEIIKGLKYTYCVDWWSFGVLLYEMLMGQSPFNGCDEDELFWSICNEQPFYPKHLTRETKQLLTLLLEKDPAHRLGVKGSSHGDICDQPFFRGVNFDQLERKQVIPPFRPQLHHPLDVSYFESAFTADEPLLTPVDADFLENVDHVQFKGFSYTNPNYTTS